MNASVLRAGGRCPMLAALLAVAACAGGPSPPQRAFSSVALAEMRPGSVNTLDVNQAVRLQRVLAPIIRQMNDPMKLNEVYVRVLDDPAINAAWGGGGDFFVTTGLLQAATDYQLRALLAIEAAHADLSHPSGVKAPADLPDAGIGVLEPIPAGSRLLKPVRAPLVVAPYTEREERDADARAVAILRRLAYDGRAVMLEGLIWMEQMKGGRNAAWIAAHPLTPARIAALENIPAPRRAPPRATSEAR